MARFDIGDFVELKPEWLRSYPALAGLFEVVRIDGDYNCGVLG